MYFKDQDMEINRNNYETFFLLYLDRELNPSEMSELDKFVNDNADLQKEFSLLRQTVLISVETEFDQKELLFRKEEKRRVIPIYWTRIAAAVAVLALGGWLLTAQLAGKQKNGLAGSDSKKNIVPAKNSAGLKTKDANSSTADLTAEAENKIQPAVQQNSTITKNQSVRNSGTAKNSTRPQNDLSGKNNAVQPMVSVNPDQGNPSPGEEADGSNMAMMQKSSAQELLPVDSQSGTDPKQISVPAGGHSPVPLIAATGTTENLRNENVMLKENEDQTDNAISVVALNDKNKAITGFFKKLTKQSPTDESTRKVRVSVFQFSY